MNKRRILSIALLAMAFCQLAVAQLRLDIVLKDKSIMSCSVDDINYMEVVEGAAPGELDGVWYLGWKILSNGTGTKTHYNGTEVIVFTAGPQMKWIKSNNELVYDITYGENGGNVGEIFYIQREGSTTKLKYQVFAKEGNLLTLKNGSTLYYFYKSQEQAANAIQPSGYLIRAQYTDGAKLWASNIKGGDSSSKITPMGKHFERFAAASEEDKEWLANPSNQPDLTYHELSGTWTAKTITLYPFGSPVPADVNQTGIGDCCMCAVFASYAYLYPDWIKSIIEKNGNNYTVHMFDPQGNPIDVVVDNKVLDYQLKGKNGKYNWATIMEKALMKWETRFQCNKIGGIGTEHASPPFTGVGSSFSFDRGDKLYIDEYELIVDYALSNGLISVGGFGEGGVVCGELETVTGHAFTVMYRDEGADYAFVMRNPWGNGGYPLDGKLKIPRERSVLRMVDFRLVFPGAAAPYKKEDLGGYTPPKFVPMDIDMYPSAEMLRMYNLESYPLHDAAAEETEELEGEVEE